MDRKCHNHVHKVQKASLLNKLKERLLIRKAILSSVLQYFDI